MVTEEELDEYVSVMKSVQPLWILAIYSQLWLLFVPINMFNRYVYSRLTKQPFVWLDTYYFDLINLALFLLVLEIHFQMENQTNEGFGVEDPPSN